MESHWPQISVARSLMVLEGAGPEAGIAEAATRAGATRARSFMLWCGVEDGVGTKAVGWDEDSFSTAG